MNIDVAASIFMISLVLCGVSPTKMDKIENRIIVSPSLLLALGEGKIM